MSIPRNLFKRHLNSSGPGNMYTPEPIRQAWPPSIESRLLALLHPDDDVPGLMRLQRVFPDLEDMRLFRLFNIFDRLRQSHAWRAFQIVYPHGSVPCSILSLKQSAVTFPQLVAALDCLSIWLDEAEESLQSAPRWSAAHQALPAVDPFLWGKQDLAGWHPRGLAPDEGPYGECEPYKLPGGKSRGDITEVLVSDSRTIHFDDRSQAEVKTVRYHESLQDEIIHQGRPLSRLSWYRSQ